MKCIRDTSHTSTGSKFHFLVDVFQAWTLSIARLDYDLAIIQHFFGQIVLGTQLALNKIPNLWRDIFNLWSWINGVKKVPLRRRQCLFCANSDYVMLTVTLVRQKALLCQKWLCNLDWIPVTGSQWGQWHCRLMPQSYVYAMSALPRSQCITENQSWFLVVFPSPKIILYNIVYGSFAVKYEIFSSVPGRPDDPLRVLCWPPVSVSRDWYWVRTESPAHIEAQGCLFKLTFWCLTLSTPKHCHMDLWLARLVLTHHHHHQLHQLPSAKSPGEGVSSSFFNSGVFSGRLPFALFWLSLELLTCSLLE